MALHAVPGQLRQRRQQFGLLGSVARQGRKIVEGGMRRATQLDEAVRQARMINRFVLLHLPHHRGARGRGVFGERLQVAPGERRMDPVQGAQQVAHLRMHALSHVVGETKANRVVGRARYGDQRRETASGQARARRAHASMPNFSGSAGSVTHSHIEPS